MTRLPSGGELYVVKRDGMGLFRLTYGNGDSNNPAWSSHHGKVAYAYQQDDLNSGIYVISADGSGKKRLVAGRAYNPHWSARGEKLLFTRRKTRYLFEVLLFEIEKKVERLLAEVETSASMKPSFSPGEAQVVYWGREPDGQGRRPTTQDIYLCDLDSGERSRLTDGACLCCAAAFSPSGEWLAWMEGTRDFHYHLCVMKSRGGERRAVTDEIYSFTPPSWCSQWSPDSSVVSYLQDGEIYLLHVASGRKRRITRPLQEESRQRLKGDNKKLVFISNVPGGVKNMMDPETKITLADRVLGAGQPFWSPDGCHVAYVRDATVYVTDTKKGDSRRVSRGKVMDDRLAWSQDGEKIIYVGEREY